jgi:hypothetical protein
VHGNPAYEEVAAVVASIRPELQRLRFAHRIPSAAVSNLVQSALRTAVAHWREIDDQALWLLGASSSSA